jgi:hypothetical protein
VSHYKLPKNDSVPWSQLIKEKRGALVVLSVQ